MNLLPADIADLVATEKKLLGRPIWDSAFDRRYHVFTAALVLVGNPVAGFELRAKVSKTFIDRDCLMQLEFSRGGRDRTELARSQWRPFETHTNKGWGPPGFEFQRFVGSSHVHPFEVNFVPNERRMRAGSLPAAIPINPDPTTLSEFFAFCGEWFRIVNIGVVEVPPQRPDMFWVQT
jgi:hypothetical protein